MQTLNVQALNPAAAGAIHGSPGGDSLMAGTAIAGTGKTHAASGKTGAETARNGSSFLAMIEKMIAGAKEGKGDANAALPEKMAGRGAGNAISVPGGDNTLIKPGTGKAGIKTVPGKNVPLTGHPLSARTGKAGQPHLSNRTGGNVQSSGEAAAKDLPAGLAERTADSGRLSLLKKDPALEVSGTAETSDGTGKSAGKKAVRGGNTAASREEAFAFAGMQNPVQVKLQADERSAKAEGSEIAEVKSAKADRKDRKTLIDVRDERTDKADALAAGSPLVKTVQVNNDGSADMTIGFRGTEGSSSSLSDGGNRLADAKKAEDGQSFASMLSQELKSNAADLVKTGSIVLRDNNAGTIRLTLHPESLGNVKISLELSDDKRISGKIVVSSQEAYEAFSENMDGLSKAFVDGGFESAGFDLSWSGQNPSGGGQDEKNARAVSPFYASSIPDVMLEHDVADTDRSGYRSSGNRAVNIFA